MKKILFLLGVFMLSISAASAQISGAPPLGWAPSRFDSSGVAANAPVLLTSPDPAGAPAGRVISFDSPEFDVDDNGPTGTLDIHLGTPLQYFHNTGATSAQAALNAFTNVAGRSTGDLFQWNGTNFARLGIGSNGDVLTASGGLATWAPNTGGAPSGAHYVVTQLDGTLTNDHLFTDGSGISSSAGTGSLTVSVDSTVIRTTGAQSMSGPKTLSGGPIISGANSTGLVLRGASFDTTVITDPASAQTVTIPSVGTSSFVMTTGAQTLGGVKTFSSSPVLSTNTITGSGANTVTLFTSSDTVVGRNTTDVLTSKELTSPSFTNNATGFTMKGSGSNTFVHTWSPGATGQTITWTNPNGNVDVAYKSGAMTANGIAYGIGNNTISATAAGTTGQFLGANTGSAPTWQTPPAGGLTQETISTTTTLTSTNKNIIYIDASGAAVDLTLPDAATNAGKFFWFRRDKSVNQVRILRGGTDTIDGPFTGAAQTSVTLVGLTGTSLGVFSDGTTTWKIIKDKGTGVSEGGTGITSCSTGQMIYASASNIWTPLALGSSGKILRSNGTNPAYSTATYPDTAGTSGNVLTSDGTNWISSAPSAVPLMKRKAADTVRTSATLTADGDLVAAVAANKTYDFVITTQSAQNNNAADLQYQLTGPSGATITFAGIHRIANTASAVTPATAGATPVTLDGASGNQTTQTISGTITVSSTAGNLSFEWANAGGANNTTLQAGSYMEVIPR